MIDDSATTDAKGSRATYDEARECYQKAQKLVSMCKRDQKALIKMKEAGVATEPVDFESAIKNIQELSITWKRD